MEELQDVDTKIHTKLIKASLDNISLGVGMIICFHPMIENTSVYRSDKQSKPARYIMGSVRHSAKIHHYVQNVNALGFVSVSR
jgi:hypothetical protein